jgi:hypothetical protein
MSRWRCLNEERIEPHLSTDQTMVNKKQKKPQPPPCPVSSTVLTPPDAFNAGAEMMMGALGAALSPSLPSSSASPLSFEAVGTYLLRDEATEASAGSAAQEHVQEGFNKNQPPIDAFGVVHAMVQAAAAETSAGKVCCSFYCSSLGCRRQVDKHKRGIVCTTCMSSDRWLRCSSTGCNAVVHAICVDNLDLEAQWKCPSCSAKACEGLPRVPEKAKEDCDECHIFDTENDMYTFLRNQGNRLSNTQASGKTWECCYCSKSFYTKRMKDNRWSAPITILHDEKCSKPVKPDVKEEKDDDVKGFKSVRYAHEFGKYPGLLQYIEILGCAGEIRTDQLQCAARMSFGVHVSSQLLYRTAKNAHDEMFGSNISDIEELLKMSEDVGEEGGFLKLFTGDISVHWSMSMLLIHQCIHFI